MLRHHYFNSSSAPVRRQLQRLRQLLRPHRLNRHHLRIGHLLVMGSPSSSSSPTNTTTTTNHAISSSPGSEVWPPITTHRDLSWQELSPTP
jgi:hypothetical protein